MAKKSTKSNTSTIKTPENTEENNTVFDNTTEAADLNKSTNTNNSEIVEVDWENIQPVFEFKQKLQNLETYFSSMCLQFEKNKANLMNQIVYGQSDLFNMAQSLQRSLNVNENLTYELKLPTAPGEKGYFLRKDD
jgi:hypothetical protein|tara:strand:+ start:130 stop:534 length:405 start_codon:yes stop_codon:yes gene_type:complete